MSIGSRIKEARESKGINQVELAKLIGISKGAIGNYETDISSPKDDILFRLMKVLNVDANYIFQDSMDKNNQECNNCKYQLSAHEAEIINAYRRNKAMQEAVDRILDVKNKGGNSCSDDLARCLRSVANQKVTKQ